MWSKALDSIKIEFFLKTSNRKWKSFDLPCDDPLADIRYDGVYLYEPSVPFVKGTYFLRLENDRVYKHLKDPALIPQMAVLARHAFLILEQAWDALGYKLVDFKVEFGIDVHGQLYIADVIDNDSWRLIKNGEYVDKQKYRDGDALDEVLQRYVEVANRSDDFGTVQDHIVTWSRQNLTRVE